MTPRPAPRRWLWRALASALAGSGITAASLGPISGGALAVEGATGGGEGTVTTTTPAEEPTKTEPTKTETTTTSTPTPSTPAPSSTPTTTPAPTATTPAGTTSAQTEIPAPAKPAAKGPAVVLQRRQKTTASKNTSTTSTTTTQPATAPAPGLAAANNNVAAAPLVVAAQAEALAAQLAGSAASTQALSFYRIPLFLLPIYQAAAVQYGVPWQILAAINEIETNYGADQSVSTAGAVGWMQFMPATWIQYGVDALNAGYADPYNPVDAIFAAARYLRAAGAATDLHAAILAYNHSDEYVKSVLLRAKLISSYPKDVIATLTGLTDGRLPVAGKAVTWGSLKTVAVSSATAHAVNVTASASAKRAGGAAAAPAPPAPSAATPGSTAAPAPAAAATSGKAVKSPPALQLVDLMSAPNAKVVAAQDGRIVKLGSSHELGKYVILRDVYGDVFTYAGLGSIASHYPKPKTSAGAAASATPSLPAVSNAEPKPKLPATAGAHPPVTLKVKKPASKGAHAGSSAAKAAAPTGAGEATAATGKVRLFAHPGNPDALASASSRKRATRSNKAGKLLALRAGAIVSQGTVLGRVSTPTQARAGHLRFAIRPGGDQSTIDPRPILQNWAQLGAALHPQGVTGDTNLLGATASGVFLMTKEELERAVLSDPGIDIYACGRQDIASGTIDKRVLAVLAFLSRIGLRPTVSALRCGHAEQTVSGYVSEHYTGDAVDISAINGTAIAGHQGAGTITDLAIRALLTLQGEFVPHQIISLMQYPGATNTLAMAEHWDHIHVGFRPATKLALTPAMAAKTAHSAGSGKAAPAPLVVPSDLSSTQWDRLVAHIGALPAPKVAVKPSSAAIKDPKQPKPKA
ncbi:MAG TPA: lytic murein transglycosylase [Solirubrobacteraceae bacterium]|nr:lytic murein transglycosylase [Solirubrobacteraceae bacterium]